MRPVSAGVGFAYRKLSLRFDAVRIANRASGASKLATTRLTYHGCGTLGVERGPITIVHGKSRVTGKSVVYARKSSVDTFT